MFVSLCVCVCRTHPLIIADGGVGHGDGVELLLDAYGHHEDVLLGEEGFEPVTRRRVETVQNETQRHMPEYAKSAPCQEEKSSLATGERTLARSLES